MESVRFCLDSVESEREVVRMFQSAQVHVYLSSFVLHLDKRLGGPEGPTPLELFHDAAARGVRLYILYNDETAYGNLEVDALRAIIPGSARVRVVKGSGVVSPFLAKLLRIQNTRYSNHHQKYIMVDDEWIMVTGVDVNEERAAWGELNQFGYMWHEVSVVMRCTPEVAQFVHDNFEWMVSVPPLPLTRGADEYYCLTRLIDESREYVHMEQQTCVSAGTTANRIFEHVAQRVARAWANALVDPFRFMLLTNVENPDESPFVSFFLKHQVYWSRRFLLARCSELGVPDEFVRERVFLGYMQFRGSAVKIHSNLTIVDGAWMLRSSSNLSDRSMSVLPCDSELGVVVHGDAVGALQQTLWSRYLEYSGGRALTHTDAFERMTLEMAMVRCIPPRVDDKYVLAVLADLWCDIVNSVNAFGGKKRIRWHNEEI